MKHIAQILSDKELTLFVPTLWQWMEYQDHPHLLGFNIQHLEVLI